MLNPEAVLRTAWSSSRFCGRLPYIFQLPTTSRCMRCLADKAGEFYPVGEERVNVTAWPRALGRGKRVAHQKDATGAALGIKPRRPQLPPLAVPADSAETASPGNGSNITLCFAKREFAPLQYRPTQPKRPPPVMAPTSRCASRSVSLRPYSTGRLSRNGR